jgi:hypothetical protein
LVQRVADIVYHSERSFADEVGAKAAFELDGRRPEPP